MQSNESSYRSIFKSTFLFGFVQVFNIVMKAAINKAVAILLGTEGMGVISLYNSAVNMLRTVAGLGIPQSAVRDVAEANATCEIEKLNRIITVTKKIVWFTALLGAVVTIVFARVLSDVYGWQGDDKDGTGIYVFVFIWHVVRFYYSCFY